MPSFARKWSASSLFGLCCAGTNRAQALLAACPVCVCACRAQVTAVCVLLLLLHLACQPYRDATTNRLETLSLLALVVIASFSDHTSFVRYLPQWSGCAL